VSPLGTALSVLTTALVAALLVPGGGDRAVAAERADTAHFEAYFPSGDGLNNLHADVLRPEGLAADAKTPVILTVSPYTNHSGEPLAAGHTNEGPSDRFFDFLDLTDALDEGYTYVMVDLPGFGGSGGCNDWGGARERGAVTAAVEWAASQSWSTGKVALLGKSYDAWTGLMGATDQPEGLAAVVSMEPVFSGYNYLYNNGVRFSNSVATPALFQVIDATPGTVHDTPQYHLNGAPQAYCYGLNEALQQIDDPADPFWQARNLLPASRTSEVPVFLTQGFLESNTKPDQAFDFFNHLAGTENRAWFGQFDHVRGWEQTADGTRTQTGRPVAAFVDQVMAFLDQHLKGTEPTSATAPGVEVQDNLGRWRTETSWPAADARTSRSTLNTGTYADDGENEAFGESAGQGVWTISQPLDRASWISGEPRLRAQVTTELPRANLVGLVYDIDPDGNARLVSRGASLLREVGTQDVVLPLYGQDWVVEAGHRVGVLLSGADASWWVHVPTTTDVVVDSATIRLPFLTQDRDEFLPGGSTPRLEDHLGQTATLSPATIEANEGAIRTRGLR
jgi:predicted acyl esterase